MSQGTRTEPKAAESTSRAPRERPREREKAAPEQAGPAPEGGVPTTRDRLAASLAGGTGKPDAKSKAEPTAAKAPKAEARSATPEAKASPTTRSRIADGARAKPAPEPKPERPKDAEPGGDFELAVEPDASLCGGRVRPPGPPRPTDRRDPHRARGPPDRDRPRTTSNHAAATVQPKLAVGRRADPFEAEADAVAAHVLRAAPPARGVHVRAPPRLRGPPSAEVPSSVTAALRSGGGVHLSPALRARIEPHLGIDLGHVRVRDGPDAAAAAADLGARAFTHGATIFLSSGASASDVGLIAHEAAHVAQQAASPSARGTVQCLEATDLIPDWILDGVKAAVQALPGYTVLTAIVGEDLVTGEPATVGPEDLVEKLLTYGPFGVAVGPLMSTIDILGDVVDALRQGLRENDLTLDRIGRDVETAWDEFSVTNGIAGNVAIVERLVRRLLRDVGSFVEGIVDQVLELVRGVVADVAEPLLETPAIQPVWSLTKKVIHYDPLRGEDVQAETVEILSDFLELIGEDERLAQMEENGTLQDTADWLDTQFETFAGLIDQLGTLFSDAWEAISPQNLPNLIENIESLAQRAFDFVQQVAEFGATLILKVLELIKDALLDFLKENAHSVPGYHLLTVILEQDPFTGETVERNAVNLIRGFITLMPGGEATYDQLAEAGVIEDAGARIESAMERLGISVDMITGLFLGIWDAVTLDDLLDPIGTFQRIIALFGEPLGRLIEFVIEVIKVLVTLILRLMNFPSELLGQIIANVQSAIDDISRDPVAFLLNMIEALKQGFMLFFDHILGHLLSGLGAWLFRGLGQLGIERPPDLTLGSIVTLVLQVLNLTVEHLWEKLGEHIGPERVAMIRGAIDRLGEAWAFITEVQRDGLPAIWRFISGQLGNLWQTLLDMATEWIMTRVISTVTTKLLSMLDPTGIMAVVNSAIAIFNAIQSAIEYFRDLLEIVARYTETVAAIAAGNVQPGATMVEQGLANAIPIAIGFLANQVGLGNIPEKVVEIIGRLRALVDRALDWLIAQALRLGRAALDALGLGNRREQPPADQPPGAAGPKQQAETLLQQRLSTAQAPNEIEQVVSGVRTELRPAGLDRLELRGPDDEGKYSIHAAASELAQLCALVPPLGGARSVTMNVRLLMHSPDPALQGQPGVGAVRQAERGPAGEIVTDPAGNPQMTTTHFTLPPVIAHGRQRSSRTTSGGVALPPVPGSGTIRLLTYNTSEDPASDNNMSHAERQLEEFLERAPDVGNDVREIHADINYSPCAICSSTLSHISRLTRRADRRIINWTTLYTHPRRGTTNATLGSISGWTVIPASVSGGPTPAEQAVLTAANWATLTA